jgi:hypothetical protein
MCLAHKPTANLTVFQAVAAASQIVDFEIVHQHDGLLAATSAAPRSLSYNPAENAVLLGSDAENGSYELYVVPKDSKGEASPVSHFSTEYMSTTLTCDQDQVTALSQNFSTLSEGCGICAQDCCWHCNCMCSMAALHGGT